MGQLPQPPSMALGFSQGTSSGSIGGSRWMHFLGHLATQVPQPVHLS